MPSCEAFEEGELPDSFCSSSCTLFSSWCTRSFRLFTVSSEMGAMVFSRRGKADRTKVKGVTTKNGGQAQGDEDQGESRVINVAGHEKAKDERYLS